MLLLACWAIECIGQEENTVRAGSTTTAVQLERQSNYLRFTDGKGRWQAGISSEQNFGTFVQRLTQLNTVIAFSPNLSWTNFLQYDTESQNVGNTMRLRWTVKPGNDIFVVWNRGWQRLLLRRRELNIIPDKDVLAIKARWTFRK